MSASEVVIRLATEAELEAIVRLERETPGSPHWNPIDYARIVHAPKQEALTRCLYVALQDEVCVGLR